MSKSIEITVSAKQYEDADDMLSAAAADVARERGLEGYDLAPRWVSGDEGEREEIALTVPAQEADAYAVYWIDDDGNEHEASGDTLEALSAELAEQGYTGSSIRVRDEQGFTRGWVSATDWRAA